MSKYGLNKVCRKDSRLGIQGVSLDRARSGKGKKLKHYNIRAYYRQKSRSWSAKKYGYGEAIRLAERWRADQIIKHENVKGEPK